MLIASKWRVMLGSLLLLDYGDAMNDEGEGSWNVANDTANPLRADFAVNMRASNAQNIIAISRIQRFASDVDARAARMDFVASLPTGYPIDATISDQLGNTWVLSEALIQPGVKHRTESNRFIYSLELAGGAVTGTASTQFAVQLLNESQIDPLVIPAGKIATVIDGRLLICRSLECDGELDLAGGELCVIGN